MTRTSEMTSVGEMANEALAKAAPQPDIATKGVYAAIVAVAADIAKTGIGKTRKNTQQGYQFRGIDDVYNELAPLLAKHQLCILPRIVSRSVVERKTKQGGALFSVTVEAEFDFVCAADGSTHTVRMYGEAMDSGDKATNKAMSAAYKYAAMQAFCIPTEGDTDADATTHEVEGQPEPPDGYDAQMLDLEAAADEGAQAVSTCWKAMKPAYRNWATKHDAERLASIKQTARNVGAKDGEEAK